MYTCCPLADHPTSITQLRTVSKPTTLKIASHSPNPDSCSCVGHSARLCQPCPPVSGAPPPTRLCRAVAAVPVNRPIRHSQMKKTHRIYPRLSVRKRRVFPQRCRTVRRYRVVPSGPLVHVIRPAGARPHALAQQGLHLVRVGFFHVQIDLDCGSRAR